MNICEVSSVAILYIVSLAFWRLSNKEKGRKRCSPATESGHLFEGRSWIAGCCSRTEIDDSQRIYGVGCTEVEEHSPVPAKQLLDGGVCDMRSGVVMKVADEAVGPALALNQTNQKMQLLAVQLCSDTGVGSQQFKQKHTLAVRPDWQHDHFSKEPRLACRSWVSGPFALNFCVQGPLFMSDESELESGLGTLERQQWYDCLDTSLAELLGHVVRYPLRNLGTNAQCPELSSYYWLWYPQIICKLTCVLLWIFFKKQVQALIIEPRWVSWQ